MIAALLCCVGIHRWLVQCYSDRTIAMMHLHPLTGTLAVCERCGTLWDDLPEYAYERMRMDAAARRGTPYRVSAEDRDRYDARLRSAGWIQLRPGVWTKDPVIDEP